MKAYKNILELLALLKLKGMVKSLDEIVNEAEAQRLSYLSLLHTLLQAEITYRAERRFQRNLAAAHFPVPKSLDSFEFGRVKGITKADIAQLLDFRCEDLSSSAIDPVDENCSIGEPSNENRNSQRDSQPPFVGFFASDAHVVCTSSSRIPTLFLHKTPVLVSP